MILRISAYSHFVYPLKEFVLALNMYYELSEYFQFIYKGNWMNFGNLKIDQKLKCAHPASNNGEGHHNKIISIS